MEKYHVFIVEPNSKKLKHEILRNKVKCLTEKRKKRLKHKISDETISTTTTNDVKNKTTEELRSLNESRVSYWNGLFCFLVLSFCIILTAPTILIPQHDGIKFPEYWYELMINVNLTFNVSWVLAVAYDGRSLLKIDSITMFGSCLRLYLATALTFDIIYCIVSIAWSIGFKYNYPIPFANIIVYISSFAFLITLWFQFPSDLRLKKEARKKILAYIYSYLWSILIALQNNFLRMIFVLLPIKFQWIMAIVMPIYRKLNMLVMNKIVKRWISHDLTAKSYVNIYINCNYALFIAISVGSTATLTTSYSILTVELVLNLYACLRIIKLNQKIKDDDVKNEELRKTKEEAIETLALTEILEILVPLAYTLTLLIAYYGPNAGILGNIQSGYWQYNAVDDVTKVLFPVFLMFSLDLVSAVIGGFLLWKFSTIKLLDEFCKIMKTYWPLITLRIAQITSKVGHLIFCFLMIYFDVLIEFCFLPDFLIDL